MVKTYQCLSCDKDYPCVLHIHAPDEGYTPKPNQCIVIDENSDIQPKWTLVRNKKAKVEKIDPVYVPPESIITL